MENENIEKYTKTTVTSLIIYIVFWVFIFTNGFANPISCFLLERFNANPDYYICGLALFSILLLTVGMIILAKTRPFKRKDVWGIILLIFYIITLGFALFTVGAVIWFQYYLTHADIDWSKVQLM